MTEETKKFLSDISLDYAEREDVLNRIGDIILKEQEETDRLTAENDKWKRMYTERFLSGDGVKNEEVPQNKEDNKEPENVNTIDDIFSRAESEE